jgi:hypothetical protein
VLLGGDERLAVAVWTTVGSGCGGGAVMTAGRRSRPAARRAIEGLMAGGCPRRGIALPAVTWTTCVVVTSTAPTAC